MWIPSAGKGLWRGEHKHTERQEDGRGPLGRCSAPRKSFSVRLARRPWPARLGPMRVNSGATRAQQQPTCEAPFLTPGRSAPDIRRGTT
jgi:hypothetical protein